MSETSIYLDGVGDVTNDLGRGVVLAGILSHEVLPASTLYDLRERQTRHEVGEPPRSLSEQEHALSSMSVMFITYSSS